MKCPCCLSSMRKIQKRCLPKWAWWKCPTCRHCKLDMDAETSAAMQVADPTCPEQGAWDTAIAERRVQILRPYAEPAKSVLDIGCGTGGLLSVMGQWHDRWGIDLVDRSRGENKAFGFLQVGLLDFAADRTWDLVMAWHVLEHVVDVRLGLSKMLDLCSPGGIVALELPVDRHLDIDRYRGHVHEFSTLSVAHLLHSVRSRSEPLYVGAAILWAGVQAILCKRPSHGDLGALTKLCAQGGKDRFRGRLRRKGVLPWMDPPGN